MIDWRRCRRVRRGLRRARLSKPTRRWRTAIYYREPTYDRRHGRAPRVFESTWTIWAASADEAVARARRRFDEFASASQVNWVREIDRIEAEPLGPTLFNGHGEYVGRYL